MPRKKSPKSVLAKRANQLRKLGFNVSYKGNVQNSPQQKAAVNRIWYKNAVFYATNPKKNRLEFRRYSKTTPKSAVRKALAPAQIYPKGYYVQRPKGVKKGDFNFRIRKDGSVYINARRGKVRDIILRLDMQAVAEDPKLALSNTLRGQKRPREFLLTVNGFDASKQTFADLESFNRYLETSLIPELEAAQFDFDRWGSEIFGVHLVYSGKGERKAKGEGKTFDFKSGGIFELSTKRVYGLKKFKDRSNWRVKKGKRKGT